MKTNPILADATQILTKGGKTLDRVLNENGNGGGSGTPNCIAIMWDAEHPLVELGESPADLWSSVDPDLPNITCPIQLVYGSIGDAYNCLVDIIFPYDVVNNSQKFESFTTLRQFSLKLLSISTEEEETTMQFDLDWVGYQDEDHPYSALPASMVTVDTTEMTVTYTVEAENQVAIAKFHVLCEGYSAVIKPAKIEVSEDGTTLTIYPYADALDVNYDITIATANPQESPTA